MRWIRSGRLILASVVLCAGLGGCAVNRPALTPEQLQERKNHYLEATSSYLRGAAQKVTLRCVKEWEDYQAGRTTQPPTLDILVLSGGGDFGAFGAGFLSGWGKVEGTQSRPDFDVVTGVSTGALIAPFAFIGDEKSFERVEHLYREPQQDWVQFRDIFFFLPGRQSFMSIDGLERDIREQVNWECVAAIAQKSREYAVLGIGTTNLDMGILMPFRLSLECERAMENGDIDRVHKILLASSAIPAAFPPVVIDDTLYVDGGTTSNILFSANMRSPDSVVRSLRREHPHVPIPKIRYWVIINNQLGAAPQVVQPTWVSITQASVATAIRSSTLGALRHLALEVDYLALTENVDAELYFIAIPDEWRAPRPGIFQRETMQSLADLGRKLGADPTSWRTDLEDTPKEGDPEQTGEEESEIHKAAPLEFPG